MFTSITNVCQPLLQNNHAAGTIMQRDDHAGFSAWSTRQKTQPYNHLRIGYMPFVLATGTGVQQPQMYQSSPFLGSIYPNYVQAQWG